MITKTIRSVVGIIRKREPRQYPDICARCNNLAEVLQIPNGNWLVQCSQDDEMHYYSIGKSRDEAIKSWNERQRRLK